jgi:hypothetical protein
MTWEGNLMKESFIDGMLLRMKEKRWLVASKLTSLLGFDLIEDFQIDPFDKNIDNHRNVVHVTTNTFVQNRRTAKMVYYSGSYCKHEMKGALPVPVSPLEGIQILKGPPKTGSGDDVPSSSKGATWSSVHCISDQRFRMVTPSMTSKKGSDSLGGASKRGDTLGRPGGPHPRSLGQSQHRLPPARGRNRKASFMGSSDDTDDESTDDSYDDEDSTDDSTDEEYNTEDHSTEKNRSRGDTVTELSGGDALRVFKLCSYADIDEDEDLGGQWLLNKEHAKSIDCKGAFPFGTGRAMSYLRIPPPALSGDKSEEGKQYDRKMQRMVSGVGRVPGHIIPTSQWGPRGVWVIGGSDGIRARQGRRILFTWNDTDYPTHPRLARGVFRNRVEGFQTRETHMGWNPTFGSLGLQPKAVLLHSPVNPLS